MTHELKIQKQWADAKLAGEKPFEIRRNDRGFQKGDIVRYRVIDPKTGGPYVPEQSDVTLPGGLVHPLEICDFVITYVREGADGLEKGYCVYADRPVPKRPVFADLRTGTTPSNGDGEPFPPPAPLAEAPGKGAHTDESVPKSSEGCKDFVGKFDGTCRFARPDLDHFGFRCRCKISPNFGKECPVERIS